MTRSKEEIEECNKVFEKLCEKEPPKNGRERTELAMIAAAMTNKKAMWDDFSDFIPHPFSYSAPYFGEDMPPANPRTFLPTDRKTCIYRITTVGDLNTGDECHVCMYTYEDGSKEEIKPNIPCGDEDCKPPDMCPFRKWLK